MNISQVSTGKVFELKKNSVTSAEQLEHSNKMHPSNDVSSLDKLDLKNLYSVVAATGYPELPCNTMPDGNTINHRNIKNQNISIQLQGVQFEFIQT